MVRAARHGGRALRAVAARRVDDVFAAAGLGLLTTGIALVSVAAALIVSGTLLLGFGVLLGLGEEPKDSDGSGRG